jgi:uncharacterized protein
MDREVDGPEVISRAEAVALLGTQEIGRLVYTRRALPAVLPVSFALHRDAIVIWTGSGSSFGRAVGGAVVAFQVDELDRATRSGWSVTVTGTARLVTDPVRIAQARAAGRWPWAPGVNDHLIRIPLTMVTGRRLGELAGIAADEGDFGRPAT